ncbi:uncharacterized protein [Typha latifolia]|uniref:uncharacterized protein isoform X1 n=2 Tax=Typha latifolia TaxID=4733 RepID=UPI003C2B74A6
MWERQRVALLPMLRPLNNRRRMVEEFLLFSKEKLIAKHRKKSVLALRKIVFFIILIFGIYICSVSLTQMENKSKPRIIKIKVKKPCRKPSIPESEIPYIHFPKPKTFDRGKCACTPVRFFAILSTQRSGSGWFETLLNSHSNISSNGEVFFEDETRNNLSSIRKTLDRVYNLDWYRSASKKRCTTVVGFKWMLNQGLVTNHAFIVNYFKRRGVSAIFLFRRNLLRQLVSLLANTHDKDHKLLNGTHKAHVRSKDEAEVLARYKPKLNATVLLSTLKHVDQYTAKAIEKFKSIRHIVLYYEDLITNHTKLLDVQDFLRVPQTELISRHVKIHTKPLSEQIENWDEVFRALKGSKYENFLNADYEM